MENRHDALEGSPYRTKEVIGQGGMGVVVLAEHKALGKAVVVKLLHDELSHPHLTERMRVEAQALAKLSHPNIVEVTDFGTTPAGRPYVVMERLEGRTLADEVKARGHLPVAEAVSYVVDVLSALEIAHKAGIVHRDIKGENVFLHRPSSTRTIVKLLDFGVAKVLSETGPVEPSRFMTEEGTLMGTPRFCSPEQAMGDRNIDHRADIYGVGTMLFLLVTGRRPFEHRLISDLLQAHASGVPPVPSTLARQPISPAVDRAILRALEKKPADRFQSASEMVDGLQAAIAAPAPSFSPAPSPSFSPAPAPAAPRTFQQIARDTVPLSSLENAAQLFPHDARSETPGRRSRHGTDLIEEPSRARSNPAFSAAPPPAPPPPVFQQQAAPSHRPLGTQRMQQMQAPPMPRPTAGPGVGPGAHPVAHPVAHPAHPGGAGPAYIDASGGRFVDPGPRPPPDKSVISAPRGDDRFRFALVFCVALVVIAIAALFVARGFIKSSKAPPAQEQPS